MPEIEIVQQCRKIKQIIPFRVYPFNHGGGGKIFCDVRVSTCEMDNLKIWNLLFCHLVVISIYPLFDWVFPYEPLRPKWWLLRKVVLFRCLCVTSLKNNKAASLLLPPRQLLRCKFWESWTERKVRKKKTITTIGIEIRVRFEAKV